MRKKYDFAGAGYVVMPEHFHLLLGEPTSGTPSVVMQVLKQGVAQKCRATSMSDNQTALFHDGMPPTRLLYSGGETWVFHFLGSGSGN